jgi:hypothetical protein
MSQEDALRILSVSGDEALARGAVDVVAPLLGTPAA